MVALDGSEPVVEFAYYAPGLLVWVDAGGGGTARWAGRIVAPPADQLGAWLVRTEDGANRRGRYGAVIPPHSAVFYYTVNLYR